MKSRKIDLFFKRKGCDEVSKVEEEIIASTSNHDEVPRVEEIITFMSNHDEVPRVEEIIIFTFDHAKVLNNDHFLKSLERDPGKSLPIWQYPSNQVDEIRRAYLNCGPYQMRLDQYPLDGRKKHPRRFQYTLFSIFPSWLEYSPSQDATFCLLCYLFNKRPSKHLREDVFITKYFRSWKRVRNGKDCAFLKHIGKDPCSPHNNAMKAYRDLLNQDAHIRHVFQIESSNQIMKNRLRLKTSIDFVRWLTLQACAFRGHDKTSESSNQGNFLELVKFLASYNDEVAKVVLQNAPYNSKYTSHHIQKELLDILATRVRKHILEEIGDSEFCILVDEARDE